jgi:hypothetical protein
LRGNEKWETKNSKYQWWGIGRYKGGRERKEKMEREREEWDSYFER